MNGIEFIVRDLIGAAPHQRFSCNAPVDGIAFEPRQKGVRLSSEQIKFIADMKGVVTIRRLQEMMQVSRGTISNIWTGRDARSRTRQ